MREEEVLADRRVGQGQKSTASAIAPPWVYWDPLFQTEHTMPKQIIRRRSPPGDSSRRQPAGGRRQGDARPQEPASSKQEIRLAPDHQGRRDVARDRPQDPT